MSKPISVLKKLINNVEDNITIELDEIIYSHKHRHEICVMHIKGKNIFPKMTPEEILSNPKAMEGLSKEDLITITRLDMSIKQKLNTYRILEMDRNGTVVLENQCKEIKRYSAKILAASVDLLNKIRGVDAFRVGYKLGLEDGLKIDKQKANPIKKLFSIIKSKI